MNKKIDIDKLVFRVVMIALIFLIISHCGVCILEDVEFKIFISMLVVFVSMIPIGIVAYIKFKNTRLYRNVVAIIVLIVLGMFIIFSGNNESYIIGMAVGTIFLIYYDFRVVIRYTVGYILVVAIFVIYYVSKGQLPEGNKITFFNILMPLLFSVIYSAMFTFSTWYIKRNHELKVNAVQEGANKTETLLEEIVDNTFFINERVKECTEYIDELELATENSNQVYERIVEGNQSSEYSIQQQTKMTKNIVDYIEKVDIDTRQAYMDTDVFMNELKYGKEYLEKLLEKSNNIMNINKRLLDTISRFSENANNVKRITDGIIDISEQTNLLSLNASIESARVGEKGKGFVLVSGEIRNLSDETAKLTNSIENILNIVQSGASKAELLIDKVEKYLDKENTTIEETIDGFKSMEDKMIKLRKGMENVSNSTKHVINYNSSIIKHIEQLSKETKEVTTYIEEALSLNELNRKKASASKEVMYKLSREVKKLEEI